MIKELKVFVGNLKLCRPHNDFIYTKKPFHLYVGNESVKSSCHVEWATYYYTTKQFFN